MDTVTTHHSISTDLTDLRYKLQHLRRISNQRISSLSDSDKQIFQDFVGTVSLLHDTDEYQLFHHEVMELFGDIRDPDPGTVAAYCVGCRDYSSCSLQCIESLPDPQRPTNLCNYNVAILETNGGVPRLKMVNRRGSTEDCIVYSSSTEITDEEKRVLEKNGIRNIHIVRDKEDLHISSFDFAPLESFVSQENDEGDYGSGSDNREYNKHNNMDTDNEDSNDGKLGTFGGIILLLLLFIVVLAGINSYRN